MLDSTFYAHIYSDPYGEFWIELQDGYRLLDPVSGNVLSDSDGYYEIDKNYLQRYGVQTVLLEHVDTGDLRLFTINDVNVPFYDMPSTIHIDNDETSYIYCRKEASSADADPRLRLGNTKLLNSSGSVLADLGPGECHTIEDLPEGASRFVTETALYYSPTNQEMAQPVEDIFKLVRQKPDPEDEPDDDDENDCGNQICPQGVTLNPETCECEPDAFN